MDKFQFKIGDYVIADRALFDTYDETFKVTGFRTNLFGERLVQVKDIASDYRTVFYPRELSWWDGTRPEEEE